MYFESNQVDVFPSTYRTRIQNGKLTSENNFVNIINSITDNVGTEGYVLDYSPTTLVLKIVLHGYYFEIKDLTINRNTNPNLWVGINVEQGGYSLVRYDNDSPKDMDSSDGKNFYGLMYNTSDDGFRESTDDNIFYKLRVSKDGEIVNKIKFSVDSINYSIDRSLRKEINSKQYIVSAGNGIDTITNVQDGTNKIGLTTTEYNKLTSLPGKGSTGRRIYFNNQGIAQEAAGENIGHDNTVSGNKVISQGVYVVDGVVKAGQTLYASTGNPEGGNPGDLWFKYVE